MTVLSCRCGPVGASSAPRQGIARVQSRLRPCLPPRARQAPPCLAMKASSPDQATTVSESVTGEKEPTREDLHALVIRLQNQVEALKSELAAVKEQQIAASTEATSSSSDAATPSSEQVRPATAPAIDPMAVDQLEKAINWPLAGSSFWEKSPRDASITLEDVSPPGQSTVTRDPSQLHIVHMTAEMAPVAKVGGLGDVVQGLAKASLERGHQVEVMLPYYTSLPPESLEGLEHVVDFDCPKGEEWDGEMRHTTLRTSVHRARIDGIPVLLISPADRNACNIFKGDRIYGGSYNELEAYLYFSRAGLETLRVLGTQPGVLHLHEWQCSAAAMLYWEVYHDAGLRTARIVLTIHNMDNSGECRQDEFGATGVSGELFADIEKALDERTIGHNPERLNLMKGGIVYSNAVTTVSPSYAEEARSGGAAGYLRTLINEPRISSKFSGVLNGIDTSFWCPSTDPLIPAPFNSAAPGGKALCKRFLQRGLGLEEDPNAPLVICITRLVPQKGIHLIRHSIGHTQGSGGQFVLLGSGHADGDFRAMAENEYRGSDSVRLMVMYSEPLAHMLYAAADFVIVPSLFEPCGLTQMIAMRYGALPVVRRTGGLADTVTDADEDPMHGSGFVFDGVDEGSCGAALDRAFQVFKEDRSRWEQMCRQNMDSDMSWRKAGEIYLGLYRAVMQA